MKHFKRFSIILFMIGLVLTSCGSNKNSSRSGSQEKYNSLSQWVEDKEYTIVSDWANPLGGGQVSLYGNYINLGRLVNPSGAGRINLIGNPNELSINKDSVRMYLPYFGEVQVLKNYGGRGGFNVEGLVSDYEVKRDDEKREINIDFEINDESENLQVSIQLFGNGNSRIILNSAYRNSISYDGTVERLKEAVEADKESPNDYFNRDQ